MSVNRSASEQGKRIILAKVTGYYGVRGWVKLYSYTDPRDNILRYGSMQVNLNGDWQNITLDTGKMHGKGVIAHFSGYDTREQTASLLGAQLAVMQADLKPLAENDYYWHDLIDLQVKNRQELLLGKVKRLIETAAHDVLVVQPEQHSNTKPEDEILIPYVPGKFVDHVDLETGLIQVDWQPEWNNGE